MLAFNNRLHICFSVSIEVDAKLFGPVDEISDFGAPNHRLRRDAPPVQARSPEKVLLDEGGIEPLVGTFDTHRETSHAATEDEKVVAVTLRHLR